MRRRLLVWPAACAAVLGTLSAAGAQGAASGTRVFERRVAFDPAEDLMEPSVAVNPANPNNVIVTYHAMWLAHDAKDASLPSTAELVAPVQHCFYSVTWDGGRHWTRRSTPTVNAPVGDPVMTDCSDQLVLFDRHGVAYLMSSAYSPAFAADEDRMIVSADGGRTWSRPVLVAGSTLSAHQSPLGHPYLLAGDADRMWLALDSSTGVLYLDGSQEWVDQQGVVHNVVWLTSSRDHGQSWSPQTVVNAPVPPGTVQNNPVVAAASGVAAVAYDTPATPGTQPSCTCVTFAVTRDRGHSFRRLRTPIPSSGGALLDAPYLAADPTHPGRFSVLVPRDSRWAVWTTDDTGRHWRKPVVVGESTANSRSHQWIQYSAAGVLAMTWRTYYPDGSYDVWMAASHNAGRSFGKAVRVSTRRSPPPTDLYVAGDDTGTLAFAGTHRIDIAWTDWRSGDQSAVWWAGLSLRAPKR